MGFSAWMPSAASVMPRSRAHADWRDQRRRDTLFAPLSPGRDELGVTGGGPRVSFSSALMNDLTWLATWFPAHATRHSVMSRCGSAETAGSRSQSVREPPVVPKRFSICFPDRSKVLLGHRPDLETVCRSAFGRSPSRLITIEAP